MKTPEERDALLAENISSIQAIPEEVLPYGDAARFVAIGLAYTWHDIAAYQSGGPRGPWCLWIGLLADARPDTNGRVLLAAWRREYVRLLREMGYTDEPGEGEGEAQPQ